MTRRRLSGAELRRAVMSAARAEVDHLRAAIGAAPLTDEEVDALRAAQAAGAREEEQRAEARRALAGLRKALSAVQRSPLALRALEVATGLRDVRAAVLALDTVEPIAAAAPLAAFVRDWGASRDGPCWARRAPTSRELALVAIVLGLRFKLPTLATPAEAIERVTIAVAREASRSPWDVKPSKGRPGRPQKPPHA